MVELSYSSIDFTNLAKLVQIMGEFKGLSLVKQVYIYVYQRVEPGFSHFGAILFLRNGALGLNTGDWE